MNKDINNISEGNMGIGAKGETNDSIIDENVHPKSKKPMIKIAVPILVVVVIFGIWAYKNLLPGSKAQGYDTSEFALDATENFDLEKILSHGLPVMINFREDYCTACREMDPILEKVNRDYRGRAVIKSVDADKNLKAAGQFGVWVIPMQFFFDAEGKPYGYHEGYLPEDEIIRILKEIGAE